MPLLRLGLGLLLLVWSAVAQSDDAAEIRRALATWTEAFNARDAAGACDLFAPDLVAQMRGPGVRGKKATCDQIAVALADDTRRLTYSADIEEIIVSGDLAAVRLVWTFRVRKGGEDRVSREPGLDLFRRQPDGAWRIARFLAYSEERDE
jgi:uncharacterized protein (TIGR02246 family)